ncbi:xylulokinase [Aliiruegeria lutimaris]|uniref:Xylulose kinase n=1 Tax=Aliiruegeria lutimaris TaxID=571298 RepID=A0A1G8RFQ1_9RHOB|nr:xylulokinase [Aliiruegeria lutimaris]SDJ15788.1 xylulokinase [Aliiruegeria lutimaris]
MYLGLDIGTSGVKAMLVDEAFATVAVAQAPLTVSRPQPGWSEQDPQDWITACEAAISQIAAEHGAALAGLKAIGLSGHMHGATLLDAADKPLRPCIMWNDGRSGQQCLELEKRADFRGIGGNIVMAGFTAPKLLWVAENEPKIFEKTAKVLLPKDYVRLWLTGEHFAEMSDAAGTLWLDVAARKWSDALLAATGLTRDHMPALGEGADVAGMLRAELAEKWGVPRVPVAGGGGDNAATACGMGVTSPGTGFLSLGTSGVLFAVTDKFAPNTDEAVHAFCHAIPKTWHQMGVILSATDSLTWLSEISGRSPADLAGLLPPKIEAPSGIGFLPYLSGERTPHNNPDASGAFLGLRRVTGLPDLVKATMEGVAMAFADCVRALRLAGTEIDAAYAVGGGARSDQWLEIMAAVTGLTLLKPEDGDFGAAFVAAKLAVSCATGDFSEEVFAKPRVDREIVPDKELAKKYAEHYQFYRDSYPALAAWQGRA